MRTDLCADHAADRWRYRFAGICVSVPDSEVAVFFIPYFHEDESDDLGIAGLGRRDEPAPLVPDLWR